MTVIELKNQIIQDLEKIEDVSFLENIAKWLHQKEETEELSPALETILEISIQQYEKGEYHSHEEVMKMLETKYGI
jgi:hypothetical protein